MGVDSRYLEQWAKDSHQKVEDEIIYNPYDKENWNSQSVHGHAVCLIGYGNNKYGDYWIIKNSWGESGGFMKIQIDAINQSINHLSTVLKMKTNIYYNFCFPIIESNGIKYPKITSIDKNNIITSIEWDKKIEKMIKVNYCKEHKGQDICSSKSGRMKEPI